MFSEWVDLTYDIKSTSHTTSESSKDITATKPNPMIAETTFWDSNKSTASK